ncbi:MAG: MaoC family dehydratase N-terminal domain-containing protein [Jatrophihabitans sp.]
MSDPILAEAERIVALGECAPRRARDPINQPMINNWVEALGETNPVYIDADAARAAGHDGIVAPPAMIQVWTMPGLHGQRTGDDPLGLMMAVLDDAGYTSVVATNCEQTYHRYLQPGEQVSITTRLEGVVGPKRTGLGDGYFVTVRNTWYVGDEPVVEMLFRVLKFAPTPPKPEPAPVIRPLISRDTAFFWAGTAAGELRIQHCPQCDTLRHPPGPMCMRCGHDKPDWVVASGRGTVFSFVVHHAPKVPGRTLPFVVALVELDEGVRMLGELLDIDPADVMVGLPVEVALTRIDDELTLPNFIPLGTRQRKGDERSREERGQPRGKVAPALQTGPEQSERSGRDAELPRWEVIATPTFVVSSALATRDFQDVHHDRDKAIARGSKDIFVNILTDTGLVQRYVTDWAGPAARIHNISIRLGVPCYAYDTLVFSGEVIAVDGEVHTVSVTGRGQLGDHVVGTVTVSGVAS